MTTREEHHPSTFELDVFFAGGKRAEGSLGSHLETCPRCRGYVEELERSSDVPFARPIESAPRAKGITRKSYRVWMTVAAGAALAALAAQVPVRLREYHGIRLQDPIRVAVGYVGAKGSPAVEALIHRESTWVWDGHSPIQPGDAIALRVACEGFTEVTVATPSTYRSDDPMMTDHPAHGATRLFEGSCPVDGEPLKFTMVADAVPSYELVTVVFRRGPLDDRALDRAMASTQPPCWPPSATCTTNVWTVWLKFPKSRGAR